jgi:hypothetical protein
MQTPNLEDETTCASRPNRDTTQEIYEKQISVIYAATNQILSNLRYIQEELRGIQTTPEPREAILKMCADFGWEIGDIRMEVRRLEDNLGMHPGEEPFRHGMESDDPKETMGFINEWLGAQLLPMHDLVTKIHTAAEHDPEAALLALLLTESATNIINEAVAFRAALDAIRTTLNPVPAQT